MFSFVYEKKIYNRKLDRHKLIFCILVSHMLYYDRKGNPLLSRKILVQQIVFFMS